MIPIALLEKIGCKTVVTFMHGLKLGAKQEHVI